MKKLTVRLNYAKTSGGAPQRGVGDAAVFPVKVLDAEGGVLGEGATTMSEPAVFNLKDDVEVAFVRLTWPSSKSETRKVDLRGDGDAEATFDDLKIARNEWSAWAVPRLSARTPMTTSADDLDLDLGRFDRVWLRMWKFVEGVWQQETVQPEARYRNGAAWQLDFSLSPHPWLLQLGGSKVVWRFVALAGGGRARVLITPGDSEDPRADALKVVATSFRADAETLLEFLARDAMRAANAMTTSTSLARDLFAEKYDDPISAVVGAYYLLRVDGWQSVPLGWFDNLVHDFSWVADTAIIRCVRQLKAGLEDKTAESEARGFFRQAVERGWPVYSEGILLLQEAASLLRKGAPRADWPMFELVEQLGAARAWAGAATSFYGRTPATPSAIQWVGMPQAPRRRRMAPELDGGGRASRSEALALGPVLAERPRASRQGARGVAVQRIEAQPVREGGEFLLGDILR